MVIKLLACQQAPTAEAIIFEDRKWSYGATGHLPARSPICQRRHQCLLACFLDEPTSALDIAHQVEVLSLVRRLREERGRRSHEIKMPARFCNEFVDLYSGTLIARGEPEK